MKKKDRDELAAKVAELAAMLEKVARPHRRLRELEETVNELAGCVTRLLEVLFEADVAGFHFGDALRKKGFSESIPF